MHDPLNTASILQEQYVTFTLTHFVLTYGAKQSFITKNKYIKVYFQINHSFIKESFLKRTKGLLFFFKSYFMRSLLAIGNRLFFFHTDYKN